MKKLTNYFYHDMLTSIIHKSNASNPIIIGICGNISVGKSTFAKNTVRNLKANFPEKKIKTICTDSFLQSNQYLKQHGLFEQKGFPVSYDQVKIERFKSAILNQKAVELTAYDHRIADINPAKVVTVNRPDIIVLEGLIVLQEPLKSLLTKSIFLDANPQIVQEWYIKRCFDLKLDQKMKLQPEDFYSYALQTWENVDVRNYLINVEPVRSQADLVLQLDSEHEVQQIQIQSSYQIKREERHEIFDE
ncbi:type I pantothenate kinase [Paucilactobacillus kaifaensis]|uniref:type I pantothenate kinase n=1 Tax=Paucilactobacillus kaifaensis TaxID=2559921 RepID=UPI0010F8C020|nr:hypothetical protein [Paucilactobacillus kaifaensis]